jgi:signal peptide peptidase SppA
MRVFDFAASQPWAITEEYLGAILDIAQRAHEPDWEAVAMKQAKRIDQADILQMRGDVAVLNVVGPIFRYANLFTSMSGATSIQELATRFRAAVDDPNVKSILLNIDSPGGEVSGISELATAIYEARKKKMVAAYVDDMAASGGYWLASSAGHIVAADTSKLGSIGVIATITEKQQEDGVKVHQFVSSVSPRKRPDLDSKDGRAQIQQVVDDLAGVFVTAVARNRGVSAEDVVSQFGKGSIVVGAKAVAVGMADEIGTFEGLIARLQAKEGLKTFGGSAANSTTGGSPMETPTITAEQKPADTQPVPVATEQPVAAEPVINAVEAAYESAFAEAEEITSLCAIAGVPLAKAHEFIKARKSAKDVRAALQEMRAADAEKTEIVSQLKPETSSHNDAKAKDNGPDILKAVVEEMKGGR